MGTDAEIRLKAREICEELATLMIEATSSPGVDSDALSEMVLAYGHAERVLASININGENGCVLHARARAMQEQYPQLSGVEAQPIGGRKYNRGP